MNSIIETKDLKLWYGDHQVLKGITMDIPEHQITALIGPSGCGKSTFLKTLNRMNDLVENVRITGEVKYDGKDIFSSNANVNELRNNVAFGPRTHGIRSKVKLDEIVERSLRDAALWDEVKDRLKTSALGMSGGQQQRLCIARALAVQPKVILCDESTASLDPISTGKIEDLLMELKSKYTVIMVTHNMQQAVRISDCCAFFLMGELIEFNWTDTLFSTPQNKKTEDYITGRFG